MSEDMTRRERWAAADQARAELNWGMRYAPDDRPHPEQLAAEAIQRGDAVFQIDIPISMYNGTINIGASWTRVWRPEPYDHIGAIERQGWRLAHMSTCYVARGASSASINRGGVTEESIHGDLIGVYVFRRAA